MSLRPERKKRQRYRQSKKREKDKDRQREGSTDEGIEKKEKGRKREQRARERKSERSKEESARSRRVSSCAPRWLPVLLGRCRVGGQPCPVRCGPDANRPLAGDTAPMHVVVEREEGVSVRSAEGEKAGEGKERGRTARHRSKEMSFD